jgi:flagellar biosynthetic protein FliP
VGLDMSKTIKTIYQLVFLLVLALSSANQAYAQSSTPATKTPSVASMIEPGTVAQAMPGIPALKLSTLPDGSQEYSVTIQILAVMTILTLLPSILMMMTAFTRIIVVFAILRQAIGLQTTPSNQVLLGLALFLTVFIMLPVLNQVNEQALQPYLEEKITSLDAIQKASEPFHRFMLTHTRESDLKLFMDISKAKPLEKAEDVPFFTLVPAFVTSELKTAFQIGFLLFIPFLIIDMVVASVLMAMGMMMLSPIIISLPFKIMLFVLVDGWALIIGSLASSYG